ncbi:MAG: ethanolamine ammonia-lyase reactivating factor EutA [Oscillospiraceae bacterium]|jgi:ethanolamine utilisation protein eutA|nr:ethanolamine ammonia-lyase reactivating factor EutA [Ruminococcus sp.]
MDETILSAGIDVGTSTTQIIFSRMTIQNTGGFGSVPKIEIVDKEIIHESEIYFTPLLSENEIDGDKVSDIVMSEYKKANLTPDMLTTGAVIITGESSRKSNARSVTEALSETAGNFVVATAGPDLESVLAGKGSGAARLSEETGKTVANFDIGGGTTNICLFRDGAAIDTACLDIGGRLIKVDESGRVTYIAQKLKKLADMSGISVSIGDILTPETAENICREMTEVIEQSAGLRKPDSRLELMITNHGMKSGIVPDIITFSGGVADCMGYSGEEQFPYGDIGVFLGHAVAASPLLTERMSETAEETIRATVIGAGNFSMEVSGSTIEYTFGSLPIKSIPVSRIKLETSEEIPSAGEQIRKGLSRYENRLTAISMKGLPCPSFKEIEAMADAVCAGAEGSDQSVLIIITEADIGKALGQALKRRINDRDFICVDGISCSDGDFIDIGEPLAHGKVLPVIVKTLIFS